MKPKSDILCIHNIALYIALYGRNQSYECELYQSTDLYIESCKIEILDYVFLHEFDVKRKKVDFSHVHCDQERLEWVTTTVVE